MGGILRVALVLCAGCGRLGFDPSSHATAADADTSLIVTTTDDTPDAPGLSLRAALAVAASQPGPDRIEFAADVFPIVPAATIALTSELVVAGDDTTIAALGRGVILAPSASYSGALVQVTGNGAVLDGLTFHGGARAIEATGVTGLAVRHATIVTPAGDGVHLDTCTNAAIEDTTIDHAAADPIALISSSDSYVRRAFISLAAKTGSVHGVEIQSSTRIHVLDSIIDPGTAWLVHLQDTSDSEIAGNILDRGDTGVAILGNSPRNTIFRNVVISPAYDSIYVATGVSATTVVNNTFFMAPDVTNLGTGTTTQNNLVSTAATDFVDPASYDFHLVAGSASIDAAADVGQDMLPASTARFLGAGPDLGGVESY